MRRSLGRDLPYIAFVVAVSSLTFLPVLGNGFVDWDDLSFVVSNRQIRGISAEHLRYMFTDISTLGYYAPVTWLSLCLDHYLSGLSARGVHLTSLLIHLANSALFYCLAVRLLDLALAAQAGERRRALRVAAVFAALVFAVHPLRVEAVAWTTARGYLLAGFFSLIVLLWHVRFASSTSEAGGGTRRLWWYTGAVTATFAASLASAPIALTLPAVLLLLDVYPLRRLPAAGNWLRGAAARVWREKALLFALALVVAVASAVAKKQQGSVESSSPLDVRFALAAYGTAAMPAKTVVPVWLSPIYPVPVQMRSTQAVYTLSAVFILATTAILAWLRKTFPAGWTAWLAYLIVIVPVCGIVRYGPQVTGDRYSYVSCMGFPLALAGACLWAYLNKPTARRALGFLSVGTVIVAALVGASRFHVKVWRDSESLFLRVLAVHPDACDAMNNLAKYYAEQGQTSRAIELYRKCIATKPTYEFAQANLGYTLVQQGELDEGIAHLRTAVSLNGQDSAMRFHLAVALARKGEIGAAVEQFRSIPGQESDIPKACSALARKLTGMQRDDLAAQIYLFGVQQSPENFSVLNNLAWLQATSSDPRVRNGRDAVLHAQRAREQAPDKNHLGLLDTMAATRAAAGEWAKAVEIAERACTLAKQASRAEIADEICGHLELFQRHQAIGNNPPAVAAQTAAAP